MRVLSLGLSYCLLSVRNHLPSSLLTAVAFHVVVHPRACSCIQFHTCTLQPERVRKERKEKKRKEKKGKRRGNTQVVATTSACQGTVLSGLLSTATSCTTVFPRPPKKKSILCLFIIIGGWARRTWTC